MDDFFDRKELIILKITVLDAKTLGDDLELSQISSLGDTAVYDTTDIGEVSERVSDSDVIVVNKIKLGEHNLSGAEKLKLICVTATGYDNIDIEYCKARNIAVCNVVGYSTQSVAQVTLAMVLSLYTHIEEYKAYTADGLYTKNKVQNHLKPVFHEIYGKTWGIIGYGNIGKQVARTAEAIGCQVLPYSRSLGMDIDDILKKSDIVSVHLPLNEDTKGLLDRKRIALMKKDAIFINVARGAVADELALTEAIENGSIAGLGVDVYSTEPFDEKHPYNRIKSMPNVCLTPHMAWGAYEARMRCIGEIAENIKVFFNGGMHNRIV